MREIGKNMNAYNDFPCCGYMREIERADGTECIAVCGKRHGHAGTHGEWRG